MKDALIFDTTALHECGAGSHASTQVLCKGLMEWLRGFRVQYVYVREFI
jgi:hypothetical protein